MVNKPKIWNSSFSLSRGSLFSKKRRSAQFQIQQMAFMIVALFIFFAIAGLFILSISLGDVQSNAQDLKTEKAISFLSTLPSMTEFNFDGTCINCLDKDKIRVFSDYMSFFRL